MDARGSGIEVVSVSREENVEKATVFVPDGKLGYFLKRFEEYATKPTPSGARSHKDFVERLAHLRLATLRALWTDSATEYPADYELLDIGDVHVRMRVTLSYFIEPNPARRGWRNRHQYASHGLRFEVTRPTESGVEFRKRVNKMQLAEGEKKPSSTGDADQWFLGPVLRHHGSLHSDLWEGTAADLARRGSIGVFPVSGWWKDQPTRDRSQVGARYSLLVSIETPGVDVDIYTAVAQQVGLPVVIQT